MFFSFLLGISTKPKGAQFNSDNPSDFEQAIADAFHFLGFESQVIGGSGDTDVILYANIGKMSYKITVDGKTSKSGKISDRQIDWFSLRDHKKKNKADAVIVVGHDFAGGNLESRANENSVGLLQTENIVRLIDSHANYPFSLVELKELLIQRGDLSSNVDDLIQQHSVRWEFIGHIKTLINEMQLIQDGKLGYFTLQSLVAREKIEDTEIEPDEIESIINLFQLPFINAIASTSGDQYLLTMGTEDIANIFYQISKTIIGEYPEQKEVPIKEKDEVSIKKTESERKLGTKYYQWEIRKSSVVAWARKEQPYIHHCPVEHFRTIIGKIISILSTKNVISVDAVSEELRGKDIGFERPYKGKPEEYKIFMALGILEVENLLQWTGAKRPIEYSLAVPVEQIQSWCDSKIRLSEG